MILDKLKQSLPEWCRVEDPPSFLEIKIDEGFQRYLVVARRDSIQMLLTVIMDNDDEKDEDPDIDISWQDNNQHTAGNCVKLSQLTGFLEHVFDMLHFGIEKAFDEAENWVDEYIPVKPKEEPPAEEPPQEAPEEPKQEVPEEPKNEVATEVPKEEPAPVCVDDLKEPGEVPNPQPAHEPVSVDTLPESPKEETANEPPKEQEVPVKPLEPPTPPPPAPLPPPPVKPLEPPRPPAPPPPVMPLMPPTPPSQKYGPPTAPLPSPFAPPVPPVAQAAGWAQVMAQQAPTPPRPSSPPPLTKERMMLIGMKMKDITRANFPNLGRYRWANEDKGDTIEYTPTPPPSGSVPPLMVGIKLIYNTLNGSWTATLWRNDEEYSSDGPTLDIIREDFISLH